MQTARRQDENARVARLRSRRKAGQLTSEKRRHKKSTKSPLEFTYKKLSLYFMLPLPIAARALGIPHTSLKKLCREIGIVRWPYVRGGLERFGRLGTAQEGNAPETLVTSMPNARGESLSHHHFCERVCVACVLVCLCVCVFACVG